MSKVMLGEVCSEYKSRIDSTEDMPVVGLEHLSQSDIDLLGSGSGSTTFTKGFRKGQMLFGRRRAYLKKASVAPFDGVCSGDIIVIEANEDRLLPELLPFVIQNDALFDFAVKNSAGSLSPRVKWGDLKRFEFNLPSLERQRDLAELLWAAQEVKRAYSSLVNECDEIVKSRFVEMFGDASSIGSRWEIRALEGCVESIDSGKSPTCSNTARVGCEPAVLKLSALSSGTFVPSENKAMLPGESILPDKEINRGDILIARKNTPELVGVCVLVREDVSSLMFPDLVFRMHPVAGVDPEYLVALLSGPSYSHRVRGLAHGSAKSMSNIPKTDLARLAVPLPPFVLQQEFATFVSRVDKSRFALQEALDSLNATMAAIVNEELGA